MKKLSILSIFVLICVITSCSSDDDKDMVDPPIDNGVYYIGNIKTIIDNNCITCHGDPLINGAPMPLLTLENVKEAIDNRNLIGRVEDGSMPNGNLIDLTADEVQAIKDWQANNFAVE